MEGHVTVQSPQYRSGSTTTMQAWSTSRMLTSSRTREESKSLRVQVQGS